MVLGAAACAPTVAPSGLTPATPTIETASFLTRDGLSLPLRYWDVARPKAVIVALHGMSDYSEAFDMPGPWLAAHGVAVYAYDQRGFGRAPDPGIWAGAQTMRNDLDDFVAALHQKYPGAPVYALGESMGGAVVLSSLASERPPQVEGIILVAPAVWSRADMPFYYNLALWIGAHTFPSSHVSGEGLNIIPSDNYPMLRKLAHDPAYQHNARVDQVYGLVNLMDQAREAPEHIVADPPILLLYGSKDQVIPASSTDAVVSELGSRATVIRYPNGYHMLLRDLEGETVWKDMLGWIEKTAVARTSARAWSRPAYAGGKN